MLHYIYIIFRDLLHFRRVREFFCSNKITFKVKIFKKTLIKISMNIKTTLFEDYVDNVNRMQNMHVKHVGAIKKMNTSN